MKKNRFTILLILALIVITPSSCDDLLGGGNIAGVDEKLISTAVDTVTTVKQEEKAKVEQKNEELTFVDSSSEKGEEKKNVDAKKFTSSDGKELITVGTMNESNEKKNVLALGGNAIEIPKGEKSKVDFKDIKDVLPPKELSTTTTALEGEAKAKTLEELKKPVEDEITKEAAKGSAMIIQAVLEASLPNKIEDAGEEREIVESFAKISEKLEEVRSGSKDLSKGDVVVLQAISNVLYKSSDALLDVIELGKQTSNKEEISDEKRKELEDKAMDLLDEVYDSAINLASITDKVSSGGASPVFEGLNLTELLNKAKSQANKEGNK